MTSDTIEQYARAIAEAVLQYLGVGHCTMVTEPQLDAIIASVPAPDVQALCRVNGCGAVATTHLCGDHVAPIDDAARREDHLLDVLSKVQVQIDAARAEEREACAQVADGERVADCNERTALCIAIAAKIRARSGARGV